MSFKNPPSLDEAFDSSELRVNISGAEVSASAPPSTMVLQLPWDVLKTATHGYQPARLEVTLPHLPTLQAPEKAGAIAALVALLHRYAQPERVVLTVNRLSEGSAAGKMSRSNVQIVVTPETSGDRLVGEVIDQLAQQPASLSTNSSADRLDATQFSNVSFTRLPADHALQEALIDAQVQRSSSYAPDLHWFLEPTEAQWRGVLIYNASLFHAPTVERMVGHLAMLLQGIQAEGDRPIHSLPLLTPAEVEQQLGTWSSPTVAYPQVPIFHAIEAHAVQQPGAIALRLNQQSLTYGELNDRANQLAHYLVTQGVAPGVRVATCFEPSLEVMVAFLAIFKAGGTYVPLDPNHPPERLTTILEDTQPPLLLSQAQCLAVIPAIAPPVFCLDQDWERLADYPRHNLNLAIDLEQTAYIIYTSGTTGKPKGVMASHANLVNYIWSAHETYGFNANDVMPSMARFTFSITMFELWSPLVAGGQLLLLERDHIFDFKRMVQTLQEITVIHASPSLWRKLLPYIDENDFAAHAFANLRHVSSGGDMVPADLLAQMKQVFTNAEVYVIYGCSEVSCMGCTYFVPRTDAETLTRVGKPFPNVAVRLYDTHQNLVPLGVSGEIYFGGAGINQGYLHQADLTARKFVDIDGVRFYRTGDLGRFDLDGNLEILGRSDFQIKLRGIRMEPGEIEARLRKMPGIRDAVVAAPQLPGNEDKSLVAYVVLEAESQPTVPAIRQFLGEALPDYMVPTIYVELQKLPLNINGKVDRKALPIPAPSDWMGTADYMAPRNLMEQKLVEIWQAAMGIHPIGVQSNFFELGGDSLMAVQILMEIEKQFGKALSITTPLIAPTIAALAALLLDFDEQNQPSGLVPLRATGSKPPLFCLYGVLLYRELMEHLDPDQPVYGVYLEEEVNMIKTGKTDLEQGDFSSVEAIAQQYLKVIRTQQPQGPYYLLGESFGGVIAYEMAQYLTQQGEEVALVAMLDSKAPNLYEQASLKHRLKMHLKMATTQGPSYLVEKIQSTLGRFKTPDRSRNKLLPNPVQPDATVPEQPPVAPLADNREAFRTHLSRQYQLKPYDGEVVLFRAMDRDPFEIDPNQDMGWGRTAKHLKTIHIPGNHLGILRAPNVKIMAQHLESYSQ